MYGFKYFATAIATASLLAACGGGGGGSGTDTPTDNGGGGGGGGTDTPQQTAGGPIRGVWNGAVSSATLNWDTTAVAMPDGRLYLLSSEFYTGETADERNKPGALLVGKGTAQDGQFSFGSGGREFSFESDWLQRSASVQGSYQPQQSFQGSITYPEDQSSRTFSTAYAGAYEGQASLDELVFNNADVRSIQGTFYAPDPAGGSIKYPVTLTVAADGSLGNRYPDAECNVSGNLNADETLDRKVFEVNLTFGAGNCPYAAGTTLNGVAFLKDSVATTSNPTVTRNRLHLAATTDDQERGVVFVQVLD